MLFVPPFDVDALRIRSLHPSVADFGTTGAIKIGYCYMAAGRILWCASWWFLRRILPRSDQPI